MIPPDHRDYDPDDNFAHSFEAGDDIDEEAALEALAWQWLLRVNPGDEDAAAAQFTAWQEVHARDPEYPPGDALLEVTDWKAGFRIAAHEPGVLVEVLDELAARWNLRIDWGVEDPSDREFLDDTGVDDLAAIAFDRLREHGYTLWLTGPGTDGVAGWIARRHDDEAMRMLAAALGIDLRPGAG